MFKTANRETAVKDVPVEELPELSSELKQRVRHPYLHVCSLRIVSRVIIFDNVLTHRRPKLSDYGRHLTSMPGLLWTLTGRDGMCSCSASMTKQRTWH